MCWAHNYSLRGNILRLCAYMHIDHHLASTRSCIESVCINNHHTHTPTHKRGDTWGLWMSGWLVYLFTRCLYPGQVISNSLMDTSLCFENISQSLPLRVFVNWQLNKEHTHTHMHRLRCSWLHSLLRVLMQVNIAKLAFPQILVSFTWQRSSLQWCWLFVGCGRVVFFFIATPHVTMKLTNWPPQDAGNTQTHAKR